MRFKTEEEIEAWIEIEKEKLENEFLKSISKNSDKIPKYREKFDADMKRLLAKYETEYNKILEKKDYSKEE